MNSSSRFLMVLICAACVFGCKNSDPVTSDQEDIIIPTDARFGYLENGKLVESKSYMQGSMSEAVIESYALPGTQMLSLSLFERDSLHEYRIALTVPFQNPPPKGSYPIVEANFPQLAEAGGSVGLDNSQFNAIQGGKLIITKFDTINNLVSGTFYFDASQIVPSSDPTITVSIRSGYFKDIPIVIGTYGQGALTAVVNEKSFSTVDQSPGSLVTGIYPGNNWGPGPGDGWELEAYEKDSNFQQTIELAVWDPHTGKSYDLGPNMNAANILYSVSPAHKADSAQSILVSSSQSGSGSLTITQFDSIAGRLSAMFSYSGQDTSGRTVTISNGVLTNVQYFTMKPKQTGGGEHR